MTRTALPIRIAVAAALGAAPAVAQVPPGMGIYFAGDSGAPVTPNNRSPGIIDIASRSVAPITGLGAGYRDINAATIDPVTGELVLGAVVNNSLLSAHRLDGSAVVQSRAISTVTANGIPLGLVGVDLDRNGNYFVANFTQVFQVDRHTGTTVVWDTLQTNGLFNALAIDREANKLYVATWKWIHPGSGLLFEYDLSAGPAPGRLIYGTGLNSALDGFITGLDTDGNGNVYISAWGFYGKTLFVHNTNNGRTRAVRGAPTSPVNAVHYDRRRKLLHLALQKSYMTLDPATGTRTVVSSPRLDRDTRINQVVVNDLLDITEVFPREPSTTAPFVLEAAAHGLPGDTAGLFVTDINGVVLAAPIAIEVGPVDEGGFLSTRLGLDPRGVPPGTSLRFQGIRLDVASGAIVFGSSVDMVFQ